MAGARIALLTATWQRERLTYHVMRHYAWMHFHERVCVSSKRGERHPGWSMTYHDNEPLSDKWQHGLAWLEGLGDFDAVMIVGSDDVITPAYLDACKYLIDGGADYIYLPGCFFYDVVENRMIWGNAERLGVGRCISRRLLNRLDCRLWESGLQKGLDGSMWRRIEALRGVGVVKITDPLKHGYAAMDIKTGENIWPFEYVKRNIISREVDPSLVLNKYFPALKNKLMRWNDRTYTP